MGEKNTRKSKMSNNVKLPAENNCVLCKMYISSKIKQFINRIHLCV